MDKSEMFWQVYLNLEDEIINISKYIYFTDNTIKINGKTNQVEAVDNETQLLTYSSYIADLLVRCCVEIEAISKELYFENGGTKQRGSTDVYFDTDCIALLNQLWGITQKEVIVSSALFNFTKDENRILTPLKGAEKRSKTYWAKSYQAVKHDRYNSLYLGNVKALLQSMAALFLLNIYYKDMRLSSTYLAYKQLDMSFGSKIFSLKLPDEKYVIDVINGKEITEIMQSNASPYILKYTDASYHKVLEANKKSNEYRQRYIWEQPEWSDPNFLEFLKKARERELQDPNYRFIFIWELCKYRLNKKIPANLSFEERKKLFVNTSEWSGRIRQLNNPKKENELTEENLQAEIDHAGIQAGMDIEQNFINIRFEKAFSEGLCELVLDKGNVRYI